MGLIPVLVLLAGLAYFGSLELYLYVTRSEAKAQTTAEAVFSEICEQHGLDPRTFRGPFPLGDDADHYEFVWSQSTGRDITVSVIYLPYDVPYSISPALIEGRPDTEPAIAP
jgi:hypothetical protein